MKNIGIILAGGSGKRIGGKVAKQYIEIGGKPLIYYSLKTFQESFIDEIVLVVRKGDEEYVRDDIVAKYGFNKVAAIVAGGAERYHSVAAGLEACSDDCDYVFIHDGARAFVTQQVLFDSLEAVKAYKAAVSAVPAKDTVKIANKDGFVENTPDRNSVYIMQTPQAFDFHCIQECYRRLIEQEDVLIAAGVKITDDAMVMEYFGDKKIFLSRGDYRNIKVTTPEDVEIASLYLG